MANVARKDGRDTLYLRNSGKPKAIYSAPKITGTQLSADRLARIRRRLLRLPRPGVPRAVRVGPLQ